MTTESERPFDRGFGLWSDAHAETVRRERERTKERRKRRMQKRCGD
jgi:hypothetical protein